MWCELRLPGGGMMLRKNLSGQWRIGEKANRHSYVRNLLFDWLFLCHWLLLRNLHIGYTAKNKIKIVFPALFCAKLWHSLIFSNEYLWERDMILPPWWLSAAITRWRTLFQPRKRRIFDEENSISAHTRIIYFSIDGLPCGFLISDIHTREKRGGIQP